jgi:hypothetical protein
MFSTKVAIPGRALHVNAIKDWARECLALDEGAALLVSELRCAEEGCPPLETVVGVFHEDGRRQQIKIHKALDEVQRDDVAHAATRGAAREHELGAGAS